MYGISLGGREIEIEGSIWRIAEKGRINMGTYLVLDLEVAGNFTHSLTLRISYRSLQARTDDTWILDAIRTYLRESRASNKANLWL